MQVSPDSFIMCGFTVTSTAVCYHVCVQYPVYAYCIQTDNILYSGKN